MREPKKNVFMRENGIILLFTSHNTGLAPKKKKLEKSWVRLKMKRPTGQWSQAQEHDITAVQDNKQITNKDNK